MTKDSGTYRALDSLEVRIGGGMMVQSHAALTQGVASAEPWMETLVDEAIVLGKFAASACGTAIAAQVSLLLSVFILGPEDPIRLYWGVALPGAVAPFAFAAICLLFGTLFLRHAMAIAVLYVRIVEVVISFIPAIINRVTVSYALRSMGAWAFGLDNVELQVLVQPVVGIHFLTPVIAMVLALTAACLILERRQLTGRPGM